MDEPADCKGQRVRLATRQDIPDLARHHRMMCDEIRKNARDPAAPSTLALVEKEYAEKLSDELGSDTCYAWVMLQEDRIVASGAISIFAYVPVPHDPSLRIAFLHSIFTEEAYRHKGYARAITDEAKRCCQALGIKRLYLVASEAGRPLYTEAGFVPVPNMMMLLQ